MRTFPKELAAFRIMVEERGARLRQLSFAELKALSQSTAEDVVVDARKGKISTNVLALPSGGIQVVLRGSLEHRFLPGESVALDGFYKYPDETASEMSEREFWKWG